MNDPIERQAAIDALVKAIRKDPYYDSNEAINGLGVCDVRVILNDLPSAQQEQRWIPVSERLPENNQDCLITKRCMKDVNVVDIVTYSTNLYLVDEYDFCDQQGESGWYYFSGEYGYCKVLNVIAWMPLPEPYREDGGE